MTHYEINASRTCSTDKYSPVLDKETQHCLQGSGCNGRKVRHIKTSGVQVHKRGEQDRRRDPHSRSKDSLHCEVISKPDSGASRVCKEVRKKLKRNCHPIFGGFSPKWTGTPFGKESAEIFILNTALID